MGTTASNQGAQTLLKNLGHAITFDLAIPENLASGISCLLRSGICGLILPIGILAGLYIMCQNF